MMADPVFGLQQWGTLAAVIASVMGVVKFLESKANGGLRRDMQQDIRTIYKAVQELKEWHDKTDEGGAPLGYSPRQQVGQKLDELIGLQRKMLTTLTRLVTLHESDQHRGGG